MNTPQEINKKLALKYIKKFDEDESLSDKLIFSTFRKFRKNTNLQHVLLKATLVDRLYNTNLRLGSSDALLSIAKRIMSIKNIDALLRKGDLKAVNKISSKPVSGKKRYSFATKYCSFSNPKKYPIYDARVDELLWRYKKEYTRKSESGGKFKFLRSDLKDYSRFKEVVERFKHHYGLDDLDFKELDKFLWRYGNAILNKPVKRTDANA